MALDRYITRGVGTVLTYGQKDVGSAGTAEILVADAECFLIYIKAKESNTGNIFVGDSDVDSGTGYILTTTCPEVILKFNHNSDNIYLDAATDGEGVSYILIL